MPEPRDDEGVPPDPSRRIARGRATRYLTLWIVLAAGCGVAFGIVITPARDAVGTAVLLGGLGALMIGNALLDGWMLHLWRARRLAKLIGHSGARLFFAAFGGWLLGSASRLVL
jgi:hypothetical protein